MIRSTFFLLLGSGLLWLPYPAGADRAAWYSDEQVTSGRKLFTQHCAVCHGPQAAATPHWKEKDALGRYPPPPLNGSAHAWHHTLDTLRLSVREGGQKLGGWMPPFGSTLSPAEIDSVIAYFQSLWPDETYQGWAKQYKVSARSVVNLEYLKKRLGVVELGTPEPTRHPGIFQIRVHDQTLYISADGEFAFIGDMIDLKQGINLRHQK